jgi:RimJ/RimL family protein N-acetyltransferase
MKKQISDFNLNVFIKGENVDLCIPTIKYAQESTWYNWFNSPKTTRFLEQGIFPNTPENQIKFLQSTWENLDRLILIICDKDSYIGTISLSSINLNKKTADIALLIGEDSNTPNSDLIALESMSLLTKFGFDRMGLIKISAGQHEKLYKWQRRLELIGYRIDGFKRNGFIKGSEVANSVSISIIRSDFELIEKFRGTLWDGTDNMRNRIQNMPQESFTERLKHLILEEGNNYYFKLYQL